MGGGIGALTLNSFFYKFYRFVSCNRKFFFAYQRHKCFG